MLMDDIISVAGPSKYWQQGFLHDELKVPSGGVQRDVVVRLVCGSMPGVC